MKHRTSMTVKLIAFASLAAVAVGSLAIVSVIGHGREIEETTSSPSSSSVSVPPSSSVSSSSTSVSSEPEPEPEPLPTGPSQGTGTDYLQWFEKDTIVEVNIDIPEEDWNAILKDPLSKTYYAATVTVNGVTVENVGFRTKGTLSLNTVAQRSYSDRYSFRVKIDKFVDKQTIWGLDEFCLNCQFQDPSYMREYLSYEALHLLDAPAPYAAYCRLSINGELWGFYLMVEAVDNSFIDRLFDGTKEDNLYKADIGSTMIYDPGFNYRSIELNKGQDTKKLGLKNFLKTLSKMPRGEKGDIESVFDVDSALKYFAVNTMLGNYDSYNGGNVHNYYLYEKDGYVTLIPWDYNLSFGGYGRDWGKTYRVGIDQPVFEQDMDRVPLIRNLLRVPEYKERYYGYIEVLLEYLDRLPERIDELAGVIRPYIEEDPTAFYSVKKFDYNIGHPGDYADVIRITKYAKDRADHVRRQLAGELPRTTDPKLMEPPKLTPDYPYDPDVIAADPDHGHDGTSVD